MGHPTAPPLAGNTLGSVDSSFVVAEWRDEGGEPTEAPRYIAPPHLHLKDDEAWYVLEGTLIVRVGDEDVTVPAGSSVIVSRGTPHTYWNPSAAPARYLLVMTPKVYGLIQAIHELPDKNREALAELFKKYDSELL